MTARALKSVEVLLVEDNRGDTILVDEALKESRETVNLNIVNNGVAALEYLRKEGNFKSASVPDLIILDLNLPLKNGFEVLKEIKSDETLKSIPVAVFTTSQSQSDILKSYGLGATFFLTKPLGFHEFMQSVRSIILNLIKSDEF